MILVFSLSALWWRRIRGLWKLPVGRDWLWGKLGLVLMCGAMLNKSLVQFSVDGWGCVPSLLFDLRPNYGGGNEDNGNFLLKVPCMHCCTQCLQHCTRPLPTHASTRDSWTLMGMFGSVSCLGQLLSPESWCFHELPNIQAGFRKKQRNQRSNCQHPLDHQKSKRAPEKHPFLLYWLCQSLWLCGSQQTVENS